MSTTARGPMPSKRQREIFGPAQPDPSHDDDFAARVAANATIRLLGSLTPVPEVERSAATLRLTTTTGE